MARRLDGKNPLAYMGVRPYTPPQLIVQTRRPTTQDYQNIELATFWIVPKQDVVPSQEVWILVGKDNNVATWIELDSGGGQVVPGAQYTILTADGSGSYGTNIAVGTAGQVLISGGGVGDAAFGVATVPGGGTGLSTIAAYNLVVGNGTAALDLIAPDATVGVPLISKGAAANPDYGTAEVAGGGTGRTTATAYAVVCGGTTATSAYQSVASVGTAGQVLTSNGAGMLPTFQNSGAGDFASIVIQTFTSNGTYTPTAGMVYCIVELVGGGGGGGGAPSGSGVGGSAGGGGGAGGYCRKLFDAATIGASQAVVIGTGGAGGVASVSPADGVDSTFGALLTASKGLAGTSGTSTQTVLGGLGGSGTGGDINIYGQPGSFGYAAVGVVQNSAGGNGGSSMYGSGGRGGRALGIFPDGANGLSYGAGGGGGASVNAAPSRNGGDGSAGICIITEYIA